MKASLGLAAAGVVVTLVGGYVALTGLSFTIQWLGAAYAIYKDDKNGTKKS